MDYSYPECNSEHDQYKADRRQQPSTSGVNQHHLQHSFATTLNFEKDAVKTTSLHKKKQRVDI